MSESSRELTPLGGSLNGGGLATLSFGIQRQARREMERVEARAAVAMATERRRGSLANLALEEVGALTAMEQHLLTVAPLGEARYREIVDSYTLGASAAIRSWR